MRKRILLIVLLLLMTFILVACGNNDERKVSQSAPIAKAVYSHDEFIYDSTLSWNSSYTDIIQKYGTPITDNNSDESLMLFYKEPKIAGMTFDRRQIIISKTTGRIIRINIYDLNDKLDDGMTKGEHLRAALLEKYGNATKEYENGDLEWENLYAETIISYTVNKNGLVNVRYENLHDYSNEAKYTDIPSGVLSTDGI